MPYSDFQGKDIVRGWIKRHPEVRSYVDFGAGAGYYGRLVKRQENPAYAIAVDGWEPYVEEFKLRDVYDRIIIGKIEELEWPEAECAIFGDVIEHFEKDEATKILRRAAEKYAHVIVSIPIGEYPQDAYQGNELERHRSTWTFEELSEVLAEFEVKSLGGTNGIFIKRT